jgi:hypothetical protein
MAHSTEQELAVLLFETEDGNYKYHAYSPATADDSLFMDKVYEIVEYNIDTPLNNNTKFGLLLEVHLRKSSILLHERNDCAYVIVREHKHCKYLPVHPTEPIYFTKDSAETYTGEHRVVSCNHTFV